MIIPVKNICLSVDVLQVNLKYLVQLILKELLQLCTGTFGKTGGPQPFKLQVVFRLQIFIWSTLLNTK